jgi:Terpene cyclase DEP1
MRKQLYLGLAVIGLIIPYYFLISFLMTYGFDARLFLRQIFGTPISTFFAVDLLLSCGVFMIYSGREASRCSMKHTWITALALFTVGLSCALPLFLYLRELALSEKPC